MMEYTAVKVNVNWRVWNEQFFPNLFLNRVSKKEVEELVNIGAGEAELANLIKRDLSLLAETFAFPNDEYICFSEMNLFNQRIDFAVFTERSRMKVVLIEIKGANFYMYNDNYYYQISSLVEQARQQILDAISNLNLKYVELTSELHRIRSAAESCKQIYNAFLGPQKCLLVDPDKDVILQGCIIAGRTRDNIRDSKKRNQEELYNPHIRLMSWDSWLNKLKR